LAEEPAFLRYLVKLALLTGEKKGTIIGKPKHTTGE